MQDFRNLRAWQKVHKLALSTYTASDPQPAALLQTAIDRPAPLSRFRQTWPKGAARAGDRDLRRFVRIAFGLGQRT